MQYQLVVDTYTGEQYEGVEHELGDEEIRDLLVRMERAKGAFLYLDGGTAGYFVIAQSDISLIHLRPVIQIAEASS